MIKTKMFQSTFHLVILKLFHAANDCFHRITGLSHQQMKRITLFSLIQTEKLAELYKLVAKSLAEIKDVIVENEEGDSSLSSTPFFKSMTLPCIKFQPRKNYQFDLFMNVSDSRVHFLNKAFHDSNSNSFVSTHVTFSRCISGMLCLERKLFSLRFL